MENTVQIAVAYHTINGHTGQCAEAVTAGAAGLGGVEVRAVNVDGITGDQWRILDAADAIVFGTPTFMGSASASFHAFAQASSRRWMIGTWRDKLAAGFTNSGAMAGDKSSTLDYLATFAAQHGMIWVSLGLRPGWNSSRGSAHDLNRLGFFAGAAAQSNLDDAEVPEADLRTATHLGRRVADYARTVAAGRRARAEEGTGRRAASLVGGE